MSSSLFAEDIFDAVDDDGQFQQLSVKVARALGARSAVLHWRLPGNDHEQEISYSGHFSADDMAKFEAGFEQDDLWAAAIRRPQASNRVWNLEELVPREAYESGRLYNEWIRSIGDDTMHALAVMVETPEISIEIAAHRGRGQATFDGKAAALLSRHVPSIQRMLRVRSKLRAQRHRAAANALDRIGHASFTLGPNRAVLHMNKLATAMVDEGAVLRLRHGRLMAAGPADEAALSTAIARALAASPESETMPLGAAVGKKLSATLVPAWENGGRQLVLIVDDGDVRDLSAEKRLRAIYRLSQAESEVAVLLALGLSPVEIALQRETSVGTIRFQIKAVAGKMDVGRQSEIVRAVLSLPKLAI